jgi:hypothetical protein
MSVEKQVWFRPLLGIWAVSLTALFGVCGFGVYQVHQYFHARATLLSLLNGDSNLALTEFAVVDLSGVRPINPDHLIELSGAFRDAAPGDADGPGSYLSIRLNSGDSVVCWSRMDRKAGTLCLEIYEVEDYRSRCHHVIRLPKRLVPAIARLFESERPPG